MKQFALNPIVSFILKIAVSVSILAALFYYIDIDDIIRSLSGANAVMVVLGFVLVIANTGIHFIRWRYLLRMLSHEISDGEVMTSLLVGFTAGFFTPAQVGEIAGRIASHPQLRKSHVVGVTIIDKLYILAVTILTGVSALALFAAAYFTEQWNAAYIFPIVVILVLICAMLLFPQSMKRYLNYIPEKIRQHNLYSMVHIIETTFFNKEGRILFVLTAGLYAVIGVQFYIFVNAFEPVSFADTVICSYSVYFVKAVILPISIGDLGVRESASIFFFSKVGVSAATAFNASLCMFLANVLLPSVIGALMIVRLKTKW